MEWLLIAVLATVIVVIGALATFVLFTRRKSPQKAPFKRTYATESVRTGEREAQEAHTEISLSQAEIQPAQGAGTDIPAEFVTMKHDSESGQGKNEKSQIYTETDKTEQIGTNAVTFSSAPMAESAQPAVTVARMADGADASHTESPQNVSEVTEAEPESVPDEGLLAQQQKKPPHFITEIESEPAKAEVKTAEPNMEPAAEESEPPPIESKTEPQKQPAKPADAEEKPKTVPPIDQAAAEQSDISTVTPEISTAAIETKSTETDTKPESPALHSIPNEQTEAERVFEILSSGKLEDFIVLAEEPLNSDNFQAVMHKIAKTTYPQRKSSKMRKIFKTHAQRYVDTFKVETPGDAISESIYKSLAIVLQEDQKFKAAIELCQQAIDLGLDDGTKTGYPGRIERLKKAQKNS